MYRKENKIISSKQDPSNYVEGYDIFDSTLLYLISNPTLPRDRYEITVYECRPDLIAKDIYGSENYMGLLLLQINKGLDELIKGTILNVLPKSILDKIISEL